MLLLLRRWKIDHRGGRLQLDVVILTTNVWKKLEAVSSEEGDGLRGDDLLLRGW